MFTSERCSLPLGSCCFDIPIQLHVTFFLLLALELMNAILRDGEIGYVLLIFVVYGPVLLITIIVHELGHALCNRKYGGEAEKIVLWPLGGFVVLGRTEGLDVMEDFWVAFCGPLTHVPMALLWFGLSLIVQSPSDFSFTIYTGDLDTFQGWWGSVCEEAVYLNIILFAFNALVPAYPLDSGRMFAALLVKCGTPVPKAAMITSITAMVLAGCMTAYGAIYLLANGTGIMFILIGCWVGYASFSLFQCARDGKAHEHPMFSKECYQEEASTTDAGGEMESTTNSSSRGPASWASTEGAASSQPKEGRDWNNWNLGGLFSKKTDEPAPAPGATTVNDAGAGNTMEPQVSTPVVEITDLNSYSSSGPSTETKEVSIWNLGALFSKKSAAQKAEPSPDGGGGVV